ncbi:MAG TPA: heme-copper oxidase subunit III [Pyrinomonadaceae bacterium]|jgi:cytochrome c oxidase subunit 3
MKIGTAETNVRARKARLKAKMSGGLGNGGQKNRGGGGGGDDDFPKNDFAERTDAPAINKFRIAMWFFLLVVLMTFSVLIGAYIFSSANGSPEWKPFNLPAQIWISTVLILASSLTYTFAQKALNAAQQQKAKNWLLATTILGAAFISSQILAWLALVKRGVYVESNPYAGFFYIMTAVHVVHVIGGIIILGYIVLRTWQVTSSESELEKRQSISKTVGWYWHFMDALWLVLFALLGFYK